MGAIFEEILPIFHKKMLACHLQSLNMHIMFSFFLAKKERLHGAYWNTELATHFYDRINIILSSLNSKKINTSIFSILNNRYLQKHENVKLYLQLKYNNLSLTSKLESTQVQKKLNILIIKQQTLTVTVNNCNVTTLV